jgi:large subunit ribosomal protein L10
VDRAEKKQAVATLHEVFSKTSVVVVAQYSGLTVAQMQRLRKQMRQAGAHVQVAKNRLDRSPSQGADPDRSFERSGGGGQGSRGFRQGSR